MQSIVYSAILNSTGTLAKESVIGDVESQILSKVNTFKNSPNGSYPGGFISSNKYKVSLLVDAGTIYVSAAIPAFSNKIIGLFLAEIRTEWKTGSKRGAAMEEYLRHQMSHFSKLDDSSDQLAQVSKQLDQVKGTMRDNLDSLLVRGEKLELVQDRTDGLVDSTTDFRKQSDRLRCQMKKRSICLTVGLIVLIICVLLAIGGGIWFIVDMTT